MQPGTKTLRNIRIHTLEKPFRCPIEGCEWEFSQKTSVSKHIKKQHDKENTTEVRKAKKYKVDSIFKCSLCAYETQRKASLKSHQARGRCKSLREKPHSIVQNATNTTLLSTV